MRKSIRFMLLFSLMLAIFAGCARKPTQPIPAPTSAQSGYVDAVELKLKCRELADQMLATVPNNALKGYVAMPTSFVDENDTSRSSPLGRLIAESMYYEFNQRGFPTREYRLTGNINVINGRNDLALANNEKVSTKGQKWAALLVGTYYVDKDATFVNARLVRASDGLVLRTGQLVLPNTPVVVRMARSGGATLASASPASSSSYSSSTSVYCDTPAAGSSNSIPIVQAR